MKKNLFLVPVIFILLIFAAFGTKAFAGLVCNECKNIEIVNKDGLYIIKIPAYGDFTVVPYISKNLITNREVFKKTGAELVINAGYFDPKNQETPSYVVMDKDVVLDPTKNKNLMENKSLQSNMSQILNRTEFRILDCHGKTKYDIAAHNAKAPYKCQIEYSVQAGPLIYPDLRLEKEYFVAQENGQVTRDSITALKKCARTAIGLQGNDIYIMIATTKHPMTLKEMSELSKELGLDKAMNFDGGGSTSLDFKGTTNPDFKNLHIVSDKDKTARKLKSFLIVY